VDDGPLKACVSAGCVSFVRKISSEMGQLQADSTEAVIRSGAATCRSGLREKASGGSHSEASGGPERTVDDSSGTPLPPASPVAPAPTFLQTAEFLDDVDCLDIET
jgi:hypothetical protein